MPATTRKRTAAAARPDPDLDDVGGDVVGMPGIIEHVVPFDRDGTIEHHTFRARPKMTYKRMMDVVKAQRGESVDRLQVFERMIRPSLLDTDGTPAAWTPQVEDRTFVDPDGDTRPVEDIAEVEAFDAGSSRRRWAALLDPDNVDVEVELDDITDFYEALVTAASDRPTSKSSRSSRT